MRNTWVTLVSILASSGYLEKSYVQIISLTKYKHVLIYFCLSGYYFYLYVLVSIPLLRENLKYRSLQ